MFPVREIERIESRALGAIRFVDAASGVIVSAALRLSLPQGVEVFRNRSGLHVIRRNPALAGHSEAFLAPPDTPPPGDVMLAFSVDDPAGVYLPRSVQLALPRDARPDHADEEDSLFRPFDVELYRTPAAPVGANWAALRVSVTESGSGDALGGAVLRVTSSGNVLARGLTDWRGEALVPVVGIPITTWSEDENAVIVTDIDATLDVYYDESHGSTRTPAAQVSQGRPPSPLPAPDPRGIEDDPDAEHADMNITLAAGAPLAVALQLDLP